MSEFDPNPEQDEVPDAAARFALALAASLALHLAVVFGVQVKAAQPVERARAMIEVRVEGAALQPKIKPLSRIEATADMTEKKPEEPKPSEEPPVLPSPVPAEPAPALEIPLLEDPTWYPAKQVDVHPVALDPVKPAYPAEGVARGVEGKVLLLLLIDEAGVVKEAAVAEADSEGIFEESALAAFRSARFAPAQKNGRAVKSRVLIRVNYELNDRKKPVVVQPPLPLPP
jgi:protein TonB